MACKPGFTGEPQITSVSGPLPPYPPSARIPLQLTITPIKVSQGRAGERGDEVEGAVNASDDTLKGEH